MQYKVRSKRDPKVFYNVGKANLTGLYTCECVAYMNGKECRHIKLIKQQGQMQINETYYRLSGSMAVDGDKVPEIGQDVDINFSGNVVKVEYRDNQDGTMDRVIVIKPIMLKENE